LRFHWGGTKLWKVTNKVGDVDSYFDSFIAMDIYVGMSRANVLQQFTVMEDIHCQTVVQENSQR
jgi:hypothetical protein